MKVVAIAAVALSILAPEPTAQDVRGRLNTYLDGYEPKLSELIADEFMEQRNVRGDSPAGGGIGPPEFRTIRSEVAFIALPGDAGWMGFRHVLRVGSRAVDDTLGQPSSAPSTAATSAASSAPSLNPKPAGCGGQT